MRTWGLWGWCLLLVATPVLASGDDAAQWLDKMSRAVQTLSYEGTFVYLHGGRLEAMHIVHRGSAKGEQERLVSLTGAAREVIRSNKTITCILPDSKSVMVDRDLPGEPFPERFPGNIARLGRDYQFQALGTDRMAGRSARVIAIKPRDRYRYGHRLWLDQKTHLLLKSDLTNARGVPVEQVMFTHLQIRDHIPDAALKPALTGRDFTWYRGGGRAGSGGPVPDSGWRVGRVPRGFTLAYHRRHKLASGSRPVEHMMYSDGLATVSVYIEEHDGDRDDRLQGLSAMGALNAYGRTVDGHQVTVVGEVPQATVRMIGRSVHHERPGKP
ncbi:MAG TPA: MucB/RseB C-terminal domain-containing protein [Gammaproteobacteria bacterium]|nr:MucB/RseB C-terminal domain-containing protein [Gammaproteobacteria bacterium]